MWHLSGPPGLLCFLWVWLPVSTGTKQDEADNLVDRENCWGAGALNAPQEVYYPSSCQAVETVGAPGNRGVITPWWMHWTSTFLGQILDVQHQLVTGSTANDAWWKCPLCYSRAFKTSWFTARGTGRYQCQGWKQEMLTGVQCANQGGTIQKIDRKRTKCPENVPLTVFGLVRFLASVSQLLRWL